MKRAGVLVSSLSFLLALLLSFAGSGYHAQTVQHLGTHASVSPGPNEGTFLLLSDIHLDPLTGTDPQVIRQLLSSPVERWQSIFDSSPDRQISPNGTDSNYALLASALEAARRSGAHYDYVIITGDFLGHDLLAKYSGFTHSDAGYREFAIHTLVFVNRMVEQAFPGVPIFETLGNNDSVEGDYMDPGAPLLETLAKEWRVVAAAPDARRDFLKGGYYAVPHPFVPNDEFIILNTAFWSNNYANSSSTGGSDQGLRELAWLKSELDGAQAAHKNATLLMHIPPGVDAYKSSQSGGCNPMLFWKKPYQDSFLAILETHASQVRDGYAGHTHMDDFTVINGASGTPYFQIHITPSISRDHRNNPAFETGVYDKTSGALADYMASYLRSSSTTGDSSQSVAWVPEYDFRQLSHLPMYSPSSLQAIALLIRSNDLIRQRFLDLYVSKATPGGSAPIKDWLSYSCAQTEVSPDSFRGCACPNPGAGR